MGEVFKLLPGAQPPAPSNLARRHRADQHEGPPARPQGGSADVRHRRGRSRRRRYVHPGGRRDPRRANASAPAAPAAATPPATAPSGPPPNCSTALREALAGVDPTRVRAGAIGLAGAARLLADPAGRAAFDRAWHDAGLRCPYAVHGDALVAYASGTAAPDGTVLIAGTGAIAAQVRDLRLDRVADGHGWLLGDAGSGFWLGREAVRRLLADLDRARTARRAAARRARRADRQRRDRAPPRATVDAIVQAVTRRPRSSWPGSRRWWSRPPPTATRPPSTLVAEAAAHLAESVARIRPAGRDRRPSCSAAACSPATPRWPPLARAEVGRRWPDAPLRPAGDGAAAAAWLAARELPELTDPTALHARLFPAPGHPRRRPTPRSAGALAGAGDGSGQGACTLGMPVDAVAPASAAGPPALPVPGLEHVSAGGPCPGCAPGGPRPGPGGPRRRARAGRAPRPCPAGRPGRTRARSAHRPGAGGELAGRRGGRWSGRDGVERIWVPRPGARTRMVSLPEPPPSRTVARSPSCCSGSFLVDPPAVYGPANEPCSNPTASVARPRRRPELVAHAGTFTRQLSVPGSAPRPPGSVTTVAVAATHRRRGLASTMLTRQLDEIRDRGEPAAVLWASEGGIYGRYGYGHGQPAGCSFDPDRREARIDGSRLGKPAWTGSACRRVPRRAIRPSPCLRPRTTRPGPRLAPATRAGGTTASADHARPPRRRRPAARPRSAGR